MIGIEMPALSGCIEDQELSSFKDDMLADVMELKVEKADNDAQYGTGNVSETNACKWKEIILQITLLSSLDHGHVADHGPGTGSPSHDQDPLNRRPAEPHHLQGEPD